MLGHRGWPGAPRQMWCAISAHPGGWCPGCPVLVAGVRAARQMVSSRAWGRAGVFPGLPGWRACGGHVLVVTLCGSGCVLAFLRARGCPGCLVDPVDPGRPARDPARMPGRVRMWCVCGVYVHHRVGYVRDRGRKPRVRVPRGSPWWTGHTWHTGTVHRERGPPGPTGRDVRGRLECTRAGMRPRRPGCANRARRSRPGGEKKRRHPPPPRH